MKFYTRIIIYIILLFFAVGALQFAGALSFGMGIEEITESGKELSLFQTTLISYFGLIGTIFLFLFAFRYLEKSTYPRSYFALDHLKRDSIFALLSVLLIIGVGTLLLFLSGQVTFQFRSFELQSVLLAFFLFLSVSIQEELFSRGLIQKVLMDSISPYAALFIASIIFALLHIANPNLSLIGFINLTLAGMLLGLIFMHTRNLWFSFIAHFLWNFLQAPLLGFNVSGKEIHSIYKINMDGSPYLTGEGFGYEGSLICTVLTAISIVCIDLYFRKSKTLLLGTQ